jgi:hypothetical protein
MTHDLKQGELEKLAKVHTGATGKDREKKEDEHAMSADDIIAGTGRKGRSSMLKVKAKTVSEKAEGEKAAEGQGDDGLGTIAEEGNEEEDKGSNTTSFLGGMFELEKEETDEGSSSSSSSDDEDDEDDKQEVVGAAAGRKMSVMGGARKTSILGGAAGIQLTAIPARRRESNLPGLAQLQQPGAGSKHGGRRESRLGLGLATGGATAQTRGRRQSRIAAAAKTNRSLSATRTSSVGARSRKFQHLGSDYMREDEARTLFEVLLAQQRAAQKEQGKEGSMSKLGIDYRLLRNELRPFVARIPVHIVRRAVFKRNAHATLTTVLALQVQC